MNTRIVVYTKNPQSNLRLHLTHPSKQAYHIYYIHSRSIVYEPYQQPKLNRRKVNQERTESKRDKTDEDSVDEVHAFVNKILFNEISLS